MDGGGIRGLIPAQVTDYMETKLFELANNYNPDAANPSILTDATS
jgi:hypothetical protein